MTKMWLSELEFRVADQCLQFFGGMGYAHESPIRRYGVMRACTASCWALPKSSHGDRALPVGESHRALRIPLTASADIACYVASSIGWRKFGGGIMKAIAAILVSALVSGGAIAQMPSAAASPHASPGTQGSAMPDADAKRDAAVEKHIKDLHTKLMITPAEESQWSQVAATMRDNAKELDRAIDKRAENTSSATAVDDLNAYADIAQAHANGVKKLASAFSGLYSAMSDDQKKTADALFSHRDQHARKTASR